MNNFSVANNSELRTMELDGVTYYASRAYCISTCITNLDIKPGVTTLNLLCPHNKTTRYLLRDVKKQFPDIKKLIISAGVSLIDISNFMFPNVQEVISANMLFSSGHVLVRGTRLLNTFCKHAEEIIDLQNVSIIDDYAMEGCMAHQFVNADKVILHYYQKAPLAGAIFTMNPKKYLKDSVFLLGRNVACINEEADTLCIPDNILGINKNLDFSHVKNLAIRNIRDASFTANVNCKSIFLQINSRIDIAKLAPLQYAENIKISEKNPYYSTIDGIIYSKDKKSLIFCPTGRQGNIIIPEGVECIASHAFCTCRGIQSVILPQSLKLIGDNAFSGSSLQEIDIPSQVTIIDEKAFEDCENLQTVTLHEGLQELQYAAFKNCISLKKIKIPSTVRYLHKHSLPSGIQEIVVASDYPRNLIASFMPDGIQRSDNTKELMEDKLCVIHIEHYGDVYMPTDISDGVIRFVNNQFNLRQIEKQYTDKLYEYVHSSSYKQSIAIKIYEKTHNKEIEKYLRRVGKSIAIDFIKNNNEERLVSFLKYGLMTPKSLKSILSQAKKANMTIAIAYILNSISELDDTTSFKL